MVDLFKAPTPVSLDSQVSVLKSDGDDGYIYIVGNDDLADFVSKSLVDSLVDSPAVATDIANRYGAHPKQSMMAEPVENTAKRILLSPRAFSRRHVARAKKLQQTRNKITVGNLGIMFLLYIIASIWSAEARSYPVSGRQSANISSFDDARRLHCWSFVPTLAPTSPAPISDNKKEKEKSKDNAMYIQCWLLALAPAPMSLAPSNDKLEYDAMHVKCQPFSPRLPPTSPALINGKEKSRHAMYLKCWLRVPTPTPSSAANMNDNKKDNPMLLFVCGYPCCGFNIHNRCDICCLKGVLHPPSATTHVKEAKNGGGDGHGGGHN